MRASGDCQVPDLGPTLLLEPSGQLCGDQIGLGRADEVAWDSRSATASDELRLQVRARRLESAACPEAIREALPNSRMHSHRQLSSASRNRKQDSECLPRVDALPRMSLGETAIASVGRCALGHNGRRPTLGPPPRAEAHESLVRQSRHSQLSQLGMQPPSEISPRSASAIASGPGSP